MARLTESARKNRTLPPIRPDARAERRYQAAIARLVREMSDSYFFWLRAQYRKTAPLIAMDAGKDSADMLRDRLEELGRQWADRFAGEAARIANWFARDTYRANTRVWQAQLRKAGFTVSLTPPEGHADAMAARIAENVSLIKSIQTEYHTQVEGMVLRSYLAGRDLESVSEGLQKRYGVSERRAALIARDQNNKATAHLNSLRQSDLGLYRAVWVHSSAGRHPRPTHVAAGRERREFDTRVGIDFGDGFGSVRPGEAINCRCVSRTIIPDIGRNS
jgi:hypothetical protein